MVLTKIQAEQYENGTLNKSNFVNVLKNGNYEFDKYILRYFNAIEDYRIESLNMRVRMYKIFGYEIEITYVLGECTQISYKTY